MAIPRLAVEHVDTFAHDVIVRRIAAALLARLDGTRCTVAANTLVALPGLETGECCRPDVSVADCAATTDDPAGALVNPLLLAEVLPPAPDGYERSGQFDPSLNLAFPLSEIYADVPFSKPEGQ